MEIIIEGKEVRVQSGDFGTILTFASEEEAKAEAEIIEILGMSYFQLPYAVDNGDGTGSLHGKLVGMGF